MLISAWATMCNALCWRNGRPTGQERQAANYDVICGFSAIWILVDMSVAPCACWLMLLTWENEVNAIKSDVKKHGMKNMFFRSFRFPVHVAAFSSATGYNYNSNSNHQNPTGSYCSFQPLTSYFQIINDDGIFQLTWCLKPLSGRTTREQNWLHIRWSRR